MKKKRLDIKKLREVQKFADEYLVKNGFIMPKDKSIINKILEDPKAPILPGMMSRPFLPHPIAINKLRRDLRAYIRIWLDSCKSSHADDENLVKFFKSIRVDLHKKVASYKRRITWSAKKKEYDLSLFTKKDSVWDTEKFFIQAFCVFLSDNKDKKVSDFVEWFYPWSEALRNYWPENVRYIDDIYTKGEPVLETKAAFNSGKDSIV